MKKYLPSLVMLAIFETVAVTLWLTKDNLFYLLNFSYIGDTPGFSSFDTERMDLVRKEELQDVFPEFAPYIGRCQFPDCAHLKEPNCAVRAALASGEIEQTRYDSYVRLYELAKEIKPWETEA